MFMTRTQLETCKSCVSYLSSSSMAKEVCFGSASGHFITYVPQHIVKIVVGFFGYLSQAGLARAGDRLKQNKQTNKHSLG